jgi:hypothetical protein
LVAHIFVSSFTSTIFYKNLFIQIKKCLTMKNIKFLTLTIIMFLAVSVSQSSAQILFPDIGSEVQLGPCRYKISGVFEGVGFEELSVKLSTGRNIPITLATGGNFGQPITVPRLSNAFAIISGGTDPANGIKIFVNGQLVRSPGQDAFVFFDTETCTL